MSENDKELKYEQSLMLIERMRAVLSLIFQIIKDEKYPNRGPITKKINKIDDSISALIGGTYKYE